MKDSLIMTFITALLALIAKQFGLDVDIVDVAWISGGGIPGEFLYKRLSKSRE